MTQIGNYRFEAPIVRGITQVLSAPLLSPEHEVLSSIRDHLEAMGRSLEQYDLPAPDIVAVDELQRYGIDNNPTLC